MRIRWWLFLVVVGAVLGPVAVFAGIYLVARSPSYCDDVGLPDAGAWQALDDHDRFVLGTDLEGCGRLTGLSAAEVTQALGSPDATRTWSDGVVLVYVLEPDEGEQVELGVRLDADQVVDATTRTRPAG